MRADAADGGVERVVVLDQPPRVAVRRANGAGIGGAVGRLDAHAPRRPATTRSSERTRSGNGPQRRPGAVRRGRDDAGDRLRVVAAHVRQRQARAVERGVERRAGACRRATRTSRRVRRPRRASVPSSSSSSAAQVGRARRGSRRSARRPTTSGPRRRRARSCPPARRAARARRAPAASRGCDDRARMATLVAACGCATSALTRAPRPAARAPRSASAAIVFDGLTPSAVGTIEPSSTCRPGVAVDAPASSTTPCAGSSAIGQPPSGWTVVNLLSGPPSSA